MSGAPDRKADAQLALTPMMAESAYDPAQPQVVEPPLDPRLSKDWALRGYVTAQDAIFRREIPLLSHRVFYAWLLESLAVPGSHLLAIRGTAGGNEWAIDAEGAVRPGPDGSYVECGFWDLFATAAFNLPGQSAQPAIAGIAAAVGRGSLTVVGHSLGGALGNFFAYECAAEVPTAARLIAPPRAGDKRFADLFAGHVVDAIAYVNPRDDVPKVPPWLSPLHCVTELEPTGGPVQIKDTRDCDHHACNYALLMDPHALDGFELTPREQALYGGCVLPAVA